MYFIALKQVVKAFTKFHHQQKKGVEKRQINSKRKERERDRAVRMCEVV